MKKSELLASGIIPLGREKRAKGLCAAGEKVMKISSAVWVRVVDEWTLWVAVLSVLPIFRSLAGGIREEPWVGGAPPPCNIIAYVTSIVKNFQSLPARPGPAPGTARRGVIAPSISARRRRSETRAVRFNRKTLISSGSANSLESAFPLFNCTCWRHGKFVARVSPPALSPSGCAFTKRMRFQRSGWDFSAGQARVGTPALSPSGWDFSAGQARVGTPALQTFHAAGHWAIAGP